MSRHNMMTAAKNNDKKWRSSGSVLGSQTQNYTEFGKCKSEHLLQPPKSCQSFFFAANLDLSRAICSRSSTTLQQIHTDPTHLRKSRDERWICVICHFKRPPYALLRVPTPLLALQDETALPGHHPTVLEPGEGDTRPGTMQEMCHCRRCWRRCSKHLWNWSPHEMSSEAPPNVLTQQLNTVASSRRFPNPQTSPRAKQRPHEISEHLQTLPIFASSPHLISLFFSTQKTPQVGKHPKPPPPQRLQLVPHNTKASPAVAPWC